MNKSWYNIYWLTMVVEKTNCLMDNPIETHTMIARIEQCAKTSSYSCIENSIESLEFGFGLACV